MKIVGPLGHALAALAALAASGCGGGSDAERVEIQTTNGPEGVTFRWTGGPAHEIAVQHCDDADCKSRKGELCSYDGETVWEVSLGDFGADLPSPTIESPVVYGTEFEGLDNFGADALVPGKPYVVSAQRYERCDERPADECFEYVLSACGYFDAP
jgi:hypothetical protein